MQNAKKGTFLATCTVILIGIVVLMLIIFLGGDGKEPSDACRHGATRVDVISSPSCTAEGSQKIVCTECGETIRTEEIALLAHDYAKDAEASLAPSCTAPGKDVFACTVCGTKRDVAVAQLDHSFAVLSESAATCTAAGVKVSACSACAKEEVVETAALGHDWQLVAREAGLVAGDCVARVCSRCSEHALATATHSYAVTADTATCTAAGEVTYTCSGCHDSYTEASDAKGHTVTDWMPDTAFTPVLKAGTTCTYTYQNKGTCENCHEGQTVQYETDVHTHVLTVVIPATCETEGEKHMVCACGHVRSGEPVKYYAEHTFVDEAGKKTCSVCGETRVVVSENSTTLGKSELAQEVELGTGAVIRLPDTVAGQVGESATLGAENLSKGELPSGTPGLDRVGDGDVIYNITLSDGETAITNFTSKVTVKLPYTLGEGEDPSRVTIFYLAEDGIELIEAVFEASAPGSREGYVTFTTDHFSYYMVGLYKDSELCARFGHNHLVSEKAPTCTEAGYYIESCRLCGEYGTRNFYEALGHSAIEVSGTPAGCTEKGQSNLECTVCGAHFTVTLPATGHKFTVDPESEVKASCTTPGTKTEVCERCEQSHTITTPQLPHILRSTVTEPSCTDGGYTTHTCATCSLSYTNAYVSAKGHAWDISAPTCAHGQICLVCGTAGESATGKHEMADGKCTVCGYGCEHSDFVKETVAPGCTLGGYTLYACSKCAREEKREHTPAAGHAFPNNFDPCTLCGAVNGDMAAAIETMLKSLASTGYTLRLEDLRVKVTEIDIIAGNVVDSYTDEITLSLGELYITRTEEKILLYMVGSLTVKEDDDAPETASIRAFGDGEYIYIAIDLPSDPLAKPGTQIGRISYDALISAIVTGVSGGGNQGGGSDSVAPMPTPPAEDEPMPPVQDYPTDDPGKEEGKEEYVEPLYSTEEEGGAVSIGEMLSGMLNEIMTNPISAPWISLLQENTNALYEGLGSILLTFFEGEKIETGYRYNFKLELLSEFLTDIRELTIAEMADKYLGEGTSDALLAYLKALPAKKITALLTEILVFADESGIPADLLISTLNQVIPMVLPEGMLPEGEEFDLLVFAEQMFASMTIGELYASLSAELPPEAEITLPAISELLVGIEEIMTERTLFELMLGEEGDEDDASVAMSGYLALLDKTMAHLFFETDAMGNIVLVEFGYDDLKWVGEYDHDLNDKIEEQDRTELALNLTLTLTLSASLPEGASSVKESFEEMRAALEDAIRAGFAAMREEDPDALYFREFTVKEGLVYLLGEDESGELVELLFSDISMLAFIPDCTNTVEVSYASDLMGEGAGGLLYYNTATGDFRDSSFHDFTKTELSGAYPEGYYKTLEDAPCGSGYGKIFVCTCGAMRQESEGTREHVRYSTVELVGASCEDGAIVTEKCFVCGVVLNVRTATNDESIQNDWHGDMNNLHTYASHACTQTPIIIESNHAEWTGNTVFYLSQCPCGWTARLEFMRGNESGCMFEGATFDSENGYTIYNCAFEDCDIAILVKNYATESAAGKNGKNCAVVLRTDYTICRIPEGKVGDVSAYVPLRETITVYDHRQIHPIVITTMKNGIYYTCRTCSLEHYEEHKSDAYGRTTYSLVWTRMNGEYVAFYEAKDVYKSNPVCAYDHYERHSPDEALRKTYSGTQHLGVSVTVQPGTCTQPAIVRGGCMLCGDGSDELRYEWIYGRYGHMWYMSGKEESDLVYTCKHCGLQSNKGDGYLSLEDLTDREGYAKEGMFVIGMSGAWYDSLDFKFSFVPKDEFYGDASVSVIPAGSLSMAVQPDDLSLNGYPYENYSFGRILISKDAVREAAEAIIGLDGVSASTVEEVLAGYNLAIQIDFREDATVGDGINGEYTVFVLEDLASHYAK